jgi:hypothetical protein
MFFLDPGQTAVSIAHLDPCLEVDDLFYGSTAPNDEQLFAALRGCVIQDGRRIDRLEIGGKNGRSNRQRTAYGQ